MGMTGILLALSDKRRAKLEKEPGLLADVLDARREERVPGLLDLGKAWHALDVMLGGESDDVLGDAVLARSGTKFGPSMSYGPVRLLSAGRVAMICDALAALPDELAFERYERLRGQDVHGRYGPKDEQGPAEYAEELAALEDDEERDEKEELARYFEALREIYREAKERGEAVLSIVT